jgi:hypothetical protein
MVDKVLEQSRLRISELHTSSSATAKALEQATNSRNHLERQLQEWRKEAEARKMKSGSGPCTSLNSNCQSDHWDVSRRLPVVPGLDELSMCDTDQCDNKLKAALNVSSSPIDRFSDASTVTGGGGGATSSTSPSGVQAVFQPVATSSDSGTAFSGLATAASVPALQSFDSRSLSTPPRPSQRPEVESRFLSSSGGVSLDWSTRSILGCFSDPLNTEEVAALHRYLNTVRAAIADRDRELQDFDAKHIQAGTLRTERIDEVEEELRKEEEQVRQLEDALRNADICIKESEEKLQLGLHGVTPLTNVAGHSNQCEAAVAAVSSRASSQASTALTQVPSAEQIWQERARALEREIQCEAAQALELQDRIHWLRAQIRKQPSAQDARMMSIQSMFGQIRNRLDSMSKQTAISEKANEDMICWPSKA